MFCEEIVRMGRRYAHTCVPKLHPKGKIAMSSETKKRAKGGKASAPDTQQANPVVFNNRQPTPIIITGGSLTISSPLADFQDANGHSVGRIVKINLPGKITELSFDDGNGTPQSPGPFKSANPSICIIYTVQETTP